MSNRPYKSSVARAESVRRVVSAGTDQSHKSGLGQFMTPSATAEFMASLFPVPGVTCHVLDAGAGVGALSCALLDRWAEGNHCFETVNIDAYEIDEKLVAHLQEHLSAYSAALPLNTRVIRGDFIEIAVPLSIARQASYSHAILNPPYKKINSGSQHRMDLSRAGLETVNLYSAFVALALDLLVPGGILVGIIPRSFANGPYYRGFRDWIFGRAAVRRLHLFDSRNTAFKDDAVLQENVIVVLERDGHQGRVTVSTSTDDTFADLEMREFPFDSIVFPGDRERFIHIPNSSAVDPLLRPDLTNRLADLQLKASTGPVVDFRVQTSLRAMPSGDTVPLLYPGHFSREGVRWPIEGFKKPNAIAVNPTTKKWLVPTGYYPVVRRFTSKEEKRRVVASVICPECFPDQQWLGLENHLNFIHQNKRGLSKALAYGLALYLNTTAVDESFRRFNGHTQVNATDLNNMRFPDQDVLAALGRKALKNGIMGQKAIDAAFDGAIR